MEVWFYRFNKRNNSTLKPSTSDRQYSIECILRQSTSIISPVIVLDKQYNGIQTCNYAYIPTWNRYYFITDIISRDDLWLVTLTLDVLASYREDIYRTSQYVLRSSKEYSYTLIDNMAVSSGYRNCSRVYVDTADGVYRKPRSSNVWSKDRTYFDSNIPNGGYIVGIVTDSASGNGVTYYGFIKSDFIDFIRNAVTLRPSNITDVSDGLKSILVDGLQYIVSVKWFPSLPTTKTANYVSSISIGGNSINVPQQRVFALNDMVVEDYYFDVDLPVHPGSYDSDKQYLRYSPYSEYNLYFQPFGDIPLDTTKIYHPTNKKIKVTWSIDYATGVSYLKIYKGGYDDELVYNASVTLGVDLPISSLSIKNEYAMMATLGWAFLKNKTSALHGTTSAVIEPSMYGPSEFTGDTLYTTGTALFNETESYRRAVDITTDIIDTGVDMLASALGQVSTLGRPESFLPYMEKPFVYLWWSQIVETDVERFGRPLNAIRTLSQLAPGFVKCADANFSGETFTFITMSERNMINSILNKGCYLE